MKKLSLSALLASTLVLTACGGEDSHNHADHGAVVGTAAQIETLTHEYHEKMKSVPAPEPAVVPIIKSVGDVSVHDLKNSAGQVVGASAQVDAITADYHEKMKAASATAANPHVGTQADIDALNAEYHEKMKAAQ